LSCRAGIKGKEEKRGILLKAKPTSIFIAGKAADGASTKLIVIGVGLVGLSILLLVVRKKNKL